MSLDAVSKNKIRGYINKNAISDLNYYEFYEVLNNKKKIKNIDFLTYFVDSICDIFSGKSNVTLKTLEKYLESNYIFLNACLYYKVDIDISIIGKIKSYKDDYVSYCKQNEIEINNSVLEIINKMDNLLNTKKSKKEDDLSTKIQSYKKEYLKHCKDNNLEADKSILKLVAIIEELLKSRSDVEDKDQISLYISKIKELETKNVEINDLLSKTEAESKSLNIIIEKLEKDIKKKETLVKQTKEELKQSVSDTKKIIKEKEKVTKELEETKDLLEFAETTLKQTEEQLEQEEFKSALLTKSVEELVEKNKEQEKIIVVVDEEKKAILREKFLDNIVLELLLKESVTFDKLVKKIKVKCKEYKFEEQEIFESIKRVGKKFNIINNDVVSIPKVYGISKPNILTERKLLLEVKDNDYINVMLIADLHIDKVDTKILRSMNQMLNYCEAHNINTILNLGDFLDSKRNMLESNSENMYLYMSLLDEIITKFPTSSNINHVIMGGNHDKDNLKFGIDPIKYISDARCDILNLGYDNAFVEFGKSNDYMMLHHGRIPYETGNTYDLLESSEKIEKNLNKYYESIGKDRDNSYIDIFGHRHESRMDSKVGYCIVPSLNKGNTGAWHLKIYFDESKKIKYMVFIPLVLNNKLYPATEQIYQKVKKL